VHRSSLVPTVNTMAKLAGLLSLRLKIGIDKTIEDIHMSGGTPDLAEPILHGPQEADQAMRNGNFWDFTKSL